VITISDSITGKARCAYCFRDCLGENLSLLVQCCRCLSPRASTLIITTTVSYTRPTLVPVLRNPHTVSPCIPPITPTRHVTLIGGGARAGDVSTLPQHAHLHPLRFRCHHRSSTSEPYQWRTSAGHFRTSYSSRNRDMRGLHGN